MAQQSIVGGLFGPTPAQIRARMREIEETALANAPTFSERMGIQAGQNIGRLLGGLTGRDMTSPELREAQQMGQEAQQIFQQAGGDTRAGMLNVAQFYFNEGAYDKGAEALKVYQSLTPAGAEEEPARVRELRIRAEEAGLKPGTPEYQEFMMKGGAGSGMSLSFNPETGSFEFVQGTGVGGGAGKIQDQVIRPDPTSPTGTRIDPVPGGKAAQEAEKIRRETEAQASTRGTTASIALRETDYLLNNLGFNRETGELGKSNVLGPRMRAIAADPKYSALFAGTATGDFLNTLQSFKDTVSIETLLQIKAAGSGLGNVPQSQLEALARILGSLDPGLSNELLAKNLKDAENVYRAIFQASMADVNDSTFRTILPGIAESALREAGGVQQEPAPEVIMQDFQEFYERGLQENPNWTEQERQQFFNLLQKEFGIQ